jgi:uncharacterized protein YaeQ
MHNKYTFQLESQDPQRPLPRKIIIGQRETESIVHVSLKLLAFVLFYRERLQVEIDVDLPYIPFTPDLVQLDYELRPNLWVECGECSISKLHKLAVKLPETEFWIIKRSRRAAEQLVQFMEKEEMRRGRYNILGLDAAMFDEFCSLTTAKNDMLWVSGTFNPPNLQFDYNGLWFDSSFTLLHF